MLLFDISKMRCSSEMHPLLHICLERVCRLLRSGVWNECAKNPFSLLPEREVDNFMTLFLSIPTFIGTKHLQLILQSGQLSRLDLSSLLLDEQKHLLPLWMSENACKNLRTLTLLHPLCDVSGVSIVTDIVHRCYNLEEFHSKLDIDINALRNCNQLRNLRLHLQVPLNAISDDFYHGIVSFVQSKPNLEVLAFCNMNEDFPAFNVLALILESCPKLISVGVADSLEALYYIRETTGSIVEFNLQRCVWGVKEIGVSSNLGLSKISTYRGKFSDLIQNAVYMCPAVHTLVIHVYHEEALEHLIHLNQLTSLSLRFKYKRTDNITALIFLLRRIGPKLQDLSLDIDDTVPVDVIRAYCFNLKLLQIYGSLVLNDEMEEVRPDGMNDFQLETLYIWKADSKSLNLLLRNSPNLYELYLGRVSCLDDKLVGGILRNSYKFTRLNTVGIMECPFLSRVGMRRLLTRSPNLKVIFFGSKKTWKVARKLFNTSFGGILMHLDSFKLNRREFYLYRPNQCSF